MKTCVIYARYSSNNQTEQSIEGQIRVCREYAQRNHLAVAGTYIDRATTGTNDNREQFQKMLKDSDKKAWDYVLCYKLDRFSRNKYEMAIHRKHLKDNGVKILSAMENIPDSPEGILLESLLEGMNQYYSEELSQKTKRGLRETRIKGNYMGGPINYGYKVVHEIIGEQTVAKVAINEDEAPVLLHIFEAYAAGNRIPDIVRELDDKGIKNRGNPFTVNSIYFMLQQEKYTGVYNIHNETFTHIYPAIIPKELFQIVRKRIDKNKTGKHVIGVDYILMGKCYCGYCGHKLRSAAGTTTNGTILRYYRCPYSKKDVNCHNKSVRKEALEDIVTNVLAEELTKPDNLKFLTDKVFELYCVNVQDGSNLHRYEKELAATDKAIKNILTAIEEGIFTPSTKQRLTELEEKKIRLEQAITIESAKEKNLLTKEDIVRYITDAVKLSAKQMIELLVERIDVHVDKICIKLRYSDTPPDITTDPTDKDSLSDNDIKEIEQNTANARPDRKFSCRGFLLFSFTKEHEISQIRTYKSGRSRVFTYTTTFMLEIYISVASDLLKKPAHFTPKRLKSARFYILLRLVTRPCTGRDNAFRSAAGPCREGCFSGVPPHPQAPFPCIRGCLPPRRKALRPCTP